MKDQEEKKDGLEETELEEVTIEEDAARTDTADSDVEADELPQGEPESDDGAEPVVDEVPEEAQADDAQAEPQESEPTALSEAEVVALVPDHLPAEMRKRLAGQEYFTESEVEQAVGAEIDYLKSVTGSGKPFGKAKKAQAPVANLSEAAEQNVKHHKAVQNKWFGG
jgi:hypothetical protein